eukprot:4132075-Amphidinium_carterae.2
MPTSRSSGSKLQLVRNDRSTLTISNDDSMSLKSFTRDHNGVQFCLVDRLPAPRERIGKLGRLSGDATAAPSVGRFRWVLAAAIREKQRVCCGSLRRLRRGGQSLRKLDPQTVCLDAGGDIQPKAPNLCFSALLRKSWALKHHMLWCTNARVAENALRVRIKRPCSAIVHP